MRLLVGLGRCILVLSQAVDGNYFSGEFGETKKAAFLPVVDWITMEAGFSPRPCGGKPE
jgi:hypothetical protein